MTMDNVLMELTHSHVTVKPATREFCVRPTSMIVLELTVVVMAHVKMELILSVVVVKLVLLATNVR